MDASIFLFLTLAALVSSGANALCDLSVDITSDPQTSIEKEETTFTCTCSGNCNITKETWEFQGSHLVFFRDLTGTNETVGPDYKGRVSTVWQCNTYTIFLSNTQMDDAGSWSCNLITEECPEGVTAKIYQEVTDRQNGSGGLEGWEIALIVLGVFGAVIVVVLIGLAYRRS